MCSLLAECVLVGFTTSKYYSEYCSKEHVSRYLGEALHFAGEGGGEEEGLAGHVVRHRVWAAALHNLADLRLETHVKHAVGLVQRQEPAHQFVPTVSSCRLSSVAGAMPCTHAHAHATRAARRMHSRLARAYVSAQYIHARACVCVCVCVCQGLLDLAELHFATLNEVNKPSGGRAHEIHTALHLAADSTHAISSENTFYIVREHILYHKTTRSTTAR
jgi:hypothetical protein